MPSKSHNKSSSKNSRSQPDLERIGLFSEIGYLSTNDPYKTPKADFLNDRIKGKQFSGVASKKGHDNMDAYFTKEYPMLFKSSESQSYNDFMKTYEDETYTDIVKIRRRWRLAEAKLNISEAPFKPANVTPKPSGAGSLFGTIAQQFPLHDNRPLDVMDSTEASKATPVAAKESGETVVLKNFLVSPPKKGSGYGYPNVTIGKHYEYISDNDPSLLAVDHPPASSEDETPRDGKPFVSSVRRISTFDPNIYKSSVAGNDDHKSISAHQPSHVNSLPFKPSSPSKSGLSGNFGKYPERMQTALRELPREVPPMQTDAFHNAKESRVNPCRSIIDANLPKAAPSWVRKAYGIV